MSNPPGSNPGDGKETMNDMEALKLFLDPEISELVILLMENGFSTFTSCSGCKGHAFDKPTIRACRNSNSDFLDKERIRLHKLLENIGYIEYVIRYCFDFRSEYGFLELEFYNIDSLTKRRMQIWRDGLVYA